MNKIRIPKSIQLGGVTYTTKWIPVAEDRGEQQMLGQSCYSANEIRLAVRDCDGVKLTKDGITETYFHELMHCILNASTYSELRKNEKLVSDLAMLIHQALKTAEY